MIRHLLWLLDRRRRRTTGRVLSFECVCAKHAWQPGCPRHGKAQR